MRHGSPVRCHLLFKVEKKEVEQVIETNKGDRSARVLVICLIWVNMRHTLHTQRYSTK